MSDGKFNGDAKNMRGGNGDTQNTSGAAPKTAAYILSAGAGAAGLTNYRILTSDGSILFTDGGPLGSYNLSVGPLADKSSNGLWRWVQKSGSDADPGSVTHPKATIASANTSLLAAIPPPAFGAAGNVSIGPGLFTGALPVLLNVSYNGTAKTATLCEGISIAAGGASLTSVNNINFINAPINLDASGAPGAILLFDIDAFSDACTIADCLDSTTSMFFLMCVFGTTSLTINGCNSLILGQCVISVPVTFNSSTTTPHTASFPSTSISSTVDINYTSGDQPMTIDLSGVTSCGQVTVTGTGVCAPGSVTLKMPLNYSGVPIITGTAGFCVIQDTNNSAAEMVFNNGLTKATTFVSAAPASNQCLMFDGLGLAFADFVRAWYLTVAGGGQVILVQDASSLVNGNVLQIVNDAVTPKSAAFQPPNLTPSSRFTSMGFQYKGNWNYTYTASGGNADVLFSSMNGGLAPDTYGSFDPLASFVVSAAAMASILITTTGTQQVKFSVSGELSYGFGTTTDDNATYQFQLKQAGSSLKNLSVTNAVSLYNNQLAPAAASTYANMSGSNSANIAAGTSLFELFLVVSGSDNAAHNLVFNNIEFRVEMWN